MSASFEGKAIIVTGAASGMGRGVAELLAERGARVAEPPGMKPTLPWEVPGPERTLRL